LTPRRFGTWFGCILCRASQSGGASRARLCSPSGCSRRVGRLLGSIPIGASREASLKKGRVSLRENVAPTLTYSAVLVDRERVDLKWRVPPTATSQFRFVLASVDDILLVRSVLREGVGFLERSDSLRVSVVVPLADPHVLVEGVQTGLILDEVWITQVQHYVVNLLDDKLSRLGIHPIRVPHVRLEDLLEVAKHLDDLEPDVRRVATTGVTYFGDLVDVEVVVDVLVRHGEAETRGVNNVEDLPGAVLRPVENTNGYSAWSRRVGTSRSISTPSRRSTLRKLHARPSRCLVP
jgi:hypothetical protein